MISWRHGLGATLCAAQLVGCASAVPSPLQPARTGSLGAPNHGLVHQLPAAEPVAGTLEFLRENQRRHALPRFAAAIARAAVRVQREAPGAPLLVGDYSSAQGGRTLPHFSHRNGLDADLLFYIESLDGVPLRTEQFVHFADDGLGYSSKLKRWVRFDERRMWLLLRALLEDPEARVQWVFFQRQLEHRLLDWAIAHGEPHELIERAAQVLLEPRPGGAHDDHFHVRTQCNLAEQAQGCIMHGPSRPWWPKEQEPELPSDQALVALLLAPLDASEAAP